MKEVKLKYKKGVLKTGIEGLSSSDFIVKDEKGNIIDVDFTDIGKGKFLLNLNNKLFTFY